MSWGVVVYVLFSMLCLCVWPGMILNQKHVSFVISDWESYLGNLFPPVFCGWLFSVLVFYLTGLFQVLVYFHVVILYFQVVSKINHHEHIPRCALVRHFILLVRGGRRIPLHKLVKWNEKNNLFQKFKKKLINRKAVCVYVYHSLCYEAPKTNRV